MDSLNKLIERFREFPGIGPRQARRFAYFLLTKNPSYLEELSRLVTDIKKTIRTCSSCFRFYSVKNGLHNSSKNENSICPICLDPSREKNLLMVVARDVDFEAIEKSGTYRGLYFILGGTVPYLEKNPETRIRLRELTATLDKRDLSEIILSLNANPEGEHTTDIIRTSVKELAEKKHTKITILGRGLSTGSELEYTDTDTIMNALRNRG
jgi:recombination protein RecR